MPLSERQLRSIQEIIKKRFTGLTLSALGERTLTTAELNTLKRAGLIEASTRSLVADPYLMGKIMAVLPSSARGLSYDQVLRASKKMLPMTGVEQKAMDYAIDNAGANIRGVMDMTLKGATTAVATARGAALRAIRDGVAESIANRDTISELKTRLFDLIDDSARDWQRVAHTEMNNSIQNGIYEEIREKSDDGDDQLVYKRPNPDACVHCRRVYLMPDGVTPRVFKLSDLADSNVGLRASEWQATVGSVHPWCSCQLIVIPEGHSFVQEKVVANPFEKGGRQYKKGQILTDAEYSGLSRDEKENTKMDAVLRNTGVTAEHTEKSLAQELLSERGCEHA